MAARLSGRAQSLIVWAAVIAWAGVIFAFSATPELRFLPDKTLDLIVRKLGHMTVYGIFALLLWRALSDTGLHRPLVWALIIAVLYAITDEVHQGFVPGRDPSAVDVGIDATGALIALVGGHMVLLRRARLDG